MAQPVSTMDTSADLRSAPGEATTAPDLGQSDPLAAPGEHAAGIARAWFDEGLGIQRDVTRAVQRTLEEVEAAIGDDDQAPTPAAILTRVVDLARAGAFLCAEAGLIAQERFSRVARSAGWPLPPETAGLPRALVLATVAADIYGGYVALRDRGRWWPSLVGPSDWEAQHRRGAARALDTAQALGGVLIKAGQFASTRADLLPRAYVETLAALQDRVPPQPWPTIRASIAGELGRPPEAVFDDLEPEPLAAASLAQVHRGRLAGRDVALKVQYPGVADVVAADLAALGQIVATIGRVEPAVRLQPIVDYLRATLPLELDFCREAAVMTDLRAALAHRDDVQIPEVVAPTTERLLVMERIDGVKIADRAGLLEAGIDPRAVARLLNDVYAEQMLRDGFLHADPHPGNLLVQPGPRLVLLDHGLTVSLPPALVGALRGMVRALLRSDWDALARSLAEAGLPVDDDFEITSLLQLAGAPVGTDTLDAVAIERLAANLGDLPIELILVGRALGMLDGITRALDPDLDILEILARYADPHPGPGSDRVSASRGRGRPG